MKLILSQDQINELRRAHRVARDKREADRIKAVYLLAIGWSLGKIAEVLMLDEDTIGNYLLNYKEGGVKKLISTNYKGSDAKFSTLELSELTIHLEEKTYLTVEAVMNHVMEQYGIQYSESGLRQLLHRIGFTYKKAKIIPGKASKQAQVEHLEMMRKVLKNKGKNDPHYFLDGVHPQHNTQASYGWIKKGKDKLIKSNTGRKRLNISGALNAETFEVIKRFDDCINAQSTIELFKLIEEKHADAKAIYLTLDNAGYHRNDLVRKYLETSKIKLLFLPPYSPNLNLIERLWKFMRKEILYNQYYEKFSEFKKAIEDFFENIGTYKEKLSRLLTSNFQLLDAG